MLSGSMEAVANSKLQAQTVYSMSEINFLTKDNIQVFGDLYISSRGKSAPVVMLFHQGGGDARGEYETIVPVILQQGFNVIAVDLRAGGNRFGSENRTVANLGEVTYSYCDAYLDLEATLDYIIKEGFTGKKFAWGSSFSGSLVFQLATNRGPELSAILSFSPASGGPMAACKADLYLKDLQTPALVLRPETEMQRESSVEQFKLFEKHGVQTYIAQNGVHGSSMLNNLIVQGDVDKHWNKVLAFINSNLKKRHK